MANGPVRLAKAALVAAIAIGVTSQAGIGGTGGAAPGDGHPTLQGDGLGGLQFGTTERVATRELTAQLGAPTGHPAAGCVGGYSDVAWHDLIAQFKHGRFRGYRYWVTRPHQSITPKLATARGITLGSTFGQLRRLYVLTQTATDFWSAAGMTFGLNSATYPSPPSAPIYEVKVNACPAAL